MAEEYNYQIVTGIVKVIRPKGKPVIGVSDGRGQFVWIQEDKIIASHPQIYTNWQTTVFAIDKDWNIQWKEENKWDDYKAQYPKKTLPMIYPVPTMFLSSQQPNYATSTSQVVNYPPPSTTVANTPNYLPQQPQYTQQPPIFTPYPPQQPQIAPHPHITTITNPPPRSIATMPNTPDNYPLQMIAIELKKIRELLELYIKPAKLITADNIQVEGMEYVDEDEPYYDDPRDESHINKDDLPDLF